MFRNLLTRARAADVVDDAAGAVGFVLMMVALVIVGAVTR